MHVPRQTKNRHSATHAIHHHPHAMTHARPSLPVIPDTNPTPPNLSPSGLHDTSAISFGAKRFKAMIKSLDITDNSNRYYPDPPVTSEETRRERYQQTSEGLEQKKSKSRKKNAGILFNENHATSIRSSAQLVFWLSLFFLPLFHCFS